MKKYILFISVILFCNNIKSQVFQDICSTVGSSTTLKSASLLDFSDISDEPIKYVRVNLIFLRKDDGTGGFQENDPDHQQYISDKQNNSNYFMANIPSGYDSHCYDGSSGLLDDSKIRFVYNVIYINNTSAWNNHTASGYCSALPSNLVALNDSIIQNSSAPAINVFYTEDSVPYDSIVVNQNCPINNGIPPTSCTTLPSFLNLNYNQAVHMRNHYTKYYWMMNCVVGNSYWDDPDESTVYGWLNAGRIEAHELAHNLALRDIDKPNGECAQHLMMHNSQGYGNFLSPDEIERMHNALSLSSARKYVTADTYSNTPISVSSNTTMDEDMRIYRGINVNNGATLEILNNVIIPSETEISVSDGSNLVIDGSNVTTPNTSSILNIAFTQNSTISIQNSSIENCDINVGSANLTLDNSTIELGSNGEFVINSGSEFLMTNSIIQ